MSKEAYYFSHDSNARYDPKISAMRSVYGTIGYGYYWIIVEMLREQEGYKLDIKSKYVWNAYALQMQCEVNACKEFILDCVNEFGLFDSDGEFFWSESLNKRMDKREKVRESKRKSAQARWSKGYNNSILEELDANAMHMHNERNANAMLVKESKVKESKEKESKEKIKYRNNVCMLKEQYEKLINKLGEEETESRITDLELWKASKGKTTKCDYSTILSWVRRDEKEGKAYKNNNTDKKLSALEQMKLKAMQEKVRIDVTPSQKLIDIGGNYE